MFVQDPLILWHINRWSGGWEGSESTAKALWKYRKSKGSMGIFPCKKYFENLHSLLHSEWLSCSKPGCAVQQGKPQPCQGLCVTGAGVCTGPAEINGSAAGADHIARPGHWMSDLWAYFFQPHFCILSLLASSRTILLVSQTPFSCTIQKVW